MSSNTFGYTADTGPRQAYGNAPRKYSPITVPVVEELSYLVIAGGGGSAQGGGGGGAGGYRNSFASE